MVPKSGHMTITKIEKWKNSLIPKMLFFSICNEK